MVYNGLCQVLHWFFEAPDPVKDKLMPKTSPTVIQKVPLLPLGERHKDCARHVKLGLELRVGHGRDGLPVVVCETATLLLRALLAHVAEPLSSNVHADDAGTRRRRRRRSHHSVSQLRHHD